MIQITPQMRLLVAVEPADFRRGINGLSRVCRELLGADPFSGTVFVFRNRGGTAVKILAYDGQGFWLCQKRLSKGRFRYCVAAQGRVLHSDDTSVRILELMGKRRVELLTEGRLPDPDRTGLFTTGVVAVTEAGPVVLFFTGRKHAGENLATLLEKRDPALAPPIQMCDGLDRNVPADHDVIESNCLSHGRRHIIDEVENFPNACRYVLETLGKVFKNESTCRKQNLHAEERLEFHQRQSGPVMAELVTWMNVELDEKRVEPNSGLGQAFRYLLKRWEKLTLFLRVPDAPIENNICERALKMAIRHRNNSLFYRSQRGAKVADVYMTLLYTAELHEQNPFHYLVALLQHEDDVAADPTAWLPWVYRETLARSPTPPRGSSHA